ncbi:MAG: hypothetical protein M1504_04105 [Candidatus Marsarchaeota archaeon]|nr:hypothetical protein [Candidatus Marsarchaeota archaeon]
MTEYENMLKEFLPALRASAARMMYSEYKLNQMKIASMLEVTQAAVSKYLNGKYSARIKDFERSFNKDDVRSFVSNILSHKTYDAQKKICMMCSRNLSFRCSLMIK